ncbi:MAG: PAS domain-containing protein, partial [Gemmiger sp.]
MTPAYSPVLNSTLFDLFAESAPDIYCFVWDLQTDYVRWSASAVEELGLPADYFGNVAQELSQRIHPADQENCLDAFRSMLKGDRKDLCSIELRLLNRRGDFIWVHLNGRMLRDKEEKPSLFAGMVKNLGSNTRCDATTGLLTVR